MIFAVVVLYLRCRPGTLHVRNTGFQRYEMLPQNDDDLQFIGQGNGYKIVRNTHAMPSDSENDDGEEDVFINIANRV